MSYDSRRIKGKIMSIRDAGKYLKWSRQNAGLTQEELSSGICSSSTLSNIENNKIKVRSKTFDLLCKKLGTSETKFPSFNSENEFYDCLKLNNARYYLSIGDYYKVSKELLSCTFLGNERADIQAEYVFLIYVLCVASRGHDSDTEKLINKSFALLELDKKRPVYFASVLEYEIYMYANMHMRNYEEVNSLLRYVKDSPITSCEREYLKMMIYACISYIYRMKGEMEKAKQTALNSIELAFENKCYVLVLDLYKSVFDNKDVLYRYFDIQSVFGAQTPIVDDDLLILKERAYRIDFLKSTSQSKFVFGVKEILKYARNHCIGGKQNIHTGLCTENAYRKYLSGAVLPSIDMFGALMERSGFSLDALVLWNTKLDNKKCNLVELGQGLGGEKDLSKIISDLKGLLSMTLPDEFWKDLYCYRLSIEELMILKEIGNTYVKMHEYNAAKRIYLFEIGYLRTKVEDAYILSLIFPDTFLKYIELLYEIGEYKQIIGLLKSRKCGEFLFDLEKAVSIIKYYDLSCDKVGEKHAFTKQIVEDFETVTEMIK